MGELRLTGGYIPIKKLVFDIQKGSFLRTYYVKPEYLTKVKQELVRRSYQYIKADQLNETYENLRRSNDYSILSRYITDSETLLNLATVFHLQERISSLNPKFIEYKMLGSIINYILTDNEVYLRGLSTIANRATRAIEVKWSASSKKEVLQEKRDNTSSATEILKFVPHFTTTEQPQIVAKKISSILSFLRPTELKLTTILEKLIATNFRDDNYILHNLLIMPQINYSRNALLERILRSIIVQKYRIIFGISTDEKAYKYLDSNWFTYNYLLLSEDARNEVMRVYPNVDVLRLMNCTTFEELLNTKLMYPDSFSSFLVLSPTFFIKNNAHKILNYIKSRESVEEKKRLLYLLFSRQDIPYTVMESILKRCDISLQEMISEVKPMLYNCIYAKQNGIVYLPFKYLINETDPFRSTFMSKLLQFIIRFKSHELIQELQQSREEVSNLTLYYNLPTYITEYRYMLGDDLPVIQHLDPLVKVTQTPVSPIHVSFTYTGDIYKIDSDIYIPCVAFIEHV